MRTGAAGLILPGMSNSTATAETNEIRVDVRALPPRERHATIFQAWGRLSDGGELLLVNDHDPLPLYYQFACEHRGTFHWQYLEQGPDTWQVRIAKGAFADPGYQPQARMAKAEPAATPHGEVVLDVRPIFERGETPCTAIDEAAAQVGPGQKLILLAPFEPVPLYAKLGRQGFRAAPRAEADGSWRIEFSR